MYAMVGRAETSIRDKLLDAQFGHILFVIRYVKYIAIPVTFVLRSHTP
jgi:hypothetical protein